MAWQRRLPVCQGFIYQVFFYNHSENLTSADLFISHAPIVYQSNAFYVFGGLVDYQPSNIIGRLDAATTTWSMAGELKVARSFHGAIFNGDAFIIAGGSRKWDETDDPAAYPTEHCSTNNGSVNCVEKAPILQYYANYPEMNLVPESFCKEM